MWNVEDAKRDDWAEEQHRWSPLMDARSGASNLEVHRSGGTLLWDWRIWGGAEGARKLETRQKEIDGALQQRS